MGDTIDNVGGNTKQLESKQQCDESDDSTNTERLCDLIHRLTDVEYALSKVQTDFLSLDGVNKINRNMLNNQMDQLVDVKKRIDVVDTLFSSRLNSVMMTVMKQVDERFKKMQNNYSKDMGRQYVLIGMIGTGVVILTALGALF